MERNRVGEELAMWNKVHTGLLKNHSKDVELHRAFKLEKLAAFEKITVRIKKGQTPAERIDLRIIKETRNKLEKELYPNYYYRIARRAIVRFVMARSIKSELSRDVGQKRTSEVSESLARQLDQAGLGELKRTIAEKIKLGQKNFSVPFSRELNSRERVEYNLRVSSNAKGEVSLAGFKATLYHGNNHTGRSHHFKMKDGNLPDIEAAGHMLAGRPILVEQTNDGLTTRQWQQLNLNDRDVDGNYKLRYSGKNFDLDNAIVVALSDHKILPEALKALTVEMEKGRLANFHYHVDGREERVQLGANPLKRGVDAYNAEGRKIEPSKKVEGTKPTVQKGKNISGEQKQVTQVKNRIGR